MFERYSENAKRSVFCARYEAEEVGSPQIEPAHIFLSLLRDAVLTSHVFRGVSVQEVREEILGRLPRRTKRSAPGDLPLSKEAREALVSAAEEADKSGSRYVGNGHILLSLLHAKNSIVAEALRRNRILVEDVLAQTEAWILTENAGTERTRKTKSFGDATDKATINEIVLDRAKQEGDREALNLVESLLAEPGRDRDSTLREVWFTAAMLARVEGDLPLVRHYCEELLASDSEDPLALYVLAGCLEQQGHHEEAKRYAEKSYANVTHPSSKLLRLLLDQRLLDPLRSQGPEPMKGSD